MALIIGACVIILGLAVFLYGCMRQRNESYGKLLFVEHPFEPGISVSRVLKGEEGARLS